MGVVALSCMFVVGLVCGLWIGPWIAGSRSVVMGSPSGEAEVSASARMSTPVDFSSDAARAHHEAALQDLREAVGLDDAQVAQVHAVFARHQGAVQDAWQAVQPQIEIAMETVHREIADLLRPEQRGRYHDWLVARRGVDPHGTAGVESPPSAPPQ